MKSRLQAIHVVVGARPSKLGQEVHHTLARHCWAQGHVWARLGPSPCLGKSKRLASWKPWNANATFKVLPFSHGLPASKIDRDEAINPELKLPAAPSLSATYQVQDIALIAFRYTIQCLQIQVVCKSDNHSCLDSFA